MSGGEVFVEACEAFDVKYIFGLPGTSIVKILDELVDSDIDYMLSLHESCAIGMADGYARASGKVGVANIHMLPGTANSIGALYNAFRDSTPLVVTCGEQDSRIIGRDAFTETPDMVGLTRQFTKWSWQVPSTERIGEALFRAFKTAASAPKGPVYLSFPKDILEGEAEVSMPSPEGFRPPAESAPDPTSIARAADLILAAGCPVIVAGSGVNLAGACEELRGLSELFAIPVVEEPLGAFIGMPSTHPLYFRQTIATRFALEQPCLQEYDLLIGVGCRMFMEFDYYPSPELKPGVDVIHFHTDPWEVAKIYPVKVGVVADIREALAALSRELEGRMTRELRRRVDERRTFLQGARARYEEELMERAREGWDSSPIKPWRLAHELTALLDEDTLLVNETTTNKAVMSAFTGYPNPEGYFAHSSAYLGWGLPAALGIKLARPEKRVLACVGDGCFMFALQSLWSAARYKIPVVMVIFNNLSYMAIKSRLHALKGQAVERQIYYGCDIDAPQVDFVRLAEGFGIQGERVEHPGEIVPVLTNALEGEEPCVVDVLLDPKVAGLKGPRLP